MFSLVLFLKIPICNHPLFCRTFNRGGGFFDPTGTARACPHDTFDTDDEARVYGASESAN